MIKCLLIGGLLIIILDILFIYLAYKRDRERLDELEDRLQEQYLKDYSQKHK